MSKESLSARRLSIITTLRCTLNCRLCNNLMPMFKNPCDVPLETIISDIDHIFELLDHIEWLQFVGGEIFMNKDMATVYEYALKYHNKFDKLILMTNATIAPRDAEIAALKKYGDQCEIMISDYGELSHKCKEMTDACKINKIPYTIRSYHGDSQYNDGWIDITGFKRFKGSDEELKKQVIKCPQVGMQNMTYIDGKLHICCNSCFMTKLGISKPASHDFVDLYDSSTTLEEKRNIVSNFYKKPVEACHICPWWNAANVERFPAAEQID